VTSLSHTVAFALDITSPIFLMLLLGILLKRRGLLSDEFITVGSRLVFTLTLPALLFINIAATDFRAVINAPLLGYAIGATLLVYLGLEWYAGQFVAQRRERGIFVQGAYRANMGIIGLALCQNAFGDPGLASASVYMAIMTILFNILAVITLSRSLNDKPPSFGTTLASIARNPLIIAILLALPFSYWQLPLPDLLRNTGHYFSRMTLPLALLCIGGSLSLRSVKHTSSVALQSTFAKLLVVPAALVTGAVALGFREVELGILYLMSSAPSAAASYVMVRAMGGNGELASNIIVLTTLASILTTSIGVLLLSAGGLIHPL